MSRGRRVCLGLYATAGVLASPWVIGWALDRAGIRPTGHLGAPSIRLSHPPRNRRHSV